MTTRRLPTLVAIAALFGLAVTACTAKSESAPAITATPSAFPNATGKLTYRTGQERVTVQFPNAAEVSRGADPGVHGDVPAADGSWSVRRTCATDVTGVCSIDVVSAGVTRRLHGDTDLQWSRDIQWSPEGHVLALRTTANVLIIIDDPASNASRTIATHVTAFAWISADALALVQDGAGLSIARVGVDGFTSANASVRQLPNYLYPSPAGNVVAFTTSGRDGWHLKTYDARYGAVQDLGPMGSDGPNATPVADVPDVKTPMYIGWSPDGTHLAFGGGYEPPFIMTIVDVSSGTVAHTTFPDGYPGEIRWTRDSKRLAVSTYNIERTHHESYVVDVTTGVATDVLSGCIIVWSPDGRFLAIHGERTPGIAIANVDTLEHTQLTHEWNDTPLSWDP